MLLPRHSRKIRAPVLRSPKPSY